MFSFNPVDDIDLDSYAYQLYDIPNPTSSTTPIKSGRNKANVFTISVTNSTDSTPKTYWGRVAVVNSAGIVGTYTSLVSPGATPLIGEQYISSLTAAKITAGTISGHAITLSGINSLIQSSIYVADNTKGWYIRGDGALSFGGPNGINYDPISGVTIGSSVTITAATGANSLSFTGLTISAGADGIAVGSSSLNYWLTSGRFRTGTATKFIEFNPAGSGSFSINGTAVENGTVGGISAATNKLYIGAGNHANVDTGFYVDSSGNFSLKNRLYWTASTNSLVIDGSVTIGATTASTLESQASLGSQNPADRINSGGTNISGDRIRTGSLVSTTGGSTINLNDGTFNLGGKLTWDGSTMIVRGDIDAGQGEFNYSDASQAALRVIRPYNNASITSRSFIAFRSSASGGLIGYISYAVGDSTRVLYAASSDERLKTEVKKDLNATDIINKMKPKTYFFNNNEHKKENFGFYAQELNEVFPQAVSSGGEDPETEPWGIDYSTLTPLLAKSIQELCGRIEYLESKLNE